MHLVLGAGGAVGGAAVRALRGRGLPVRILARPDSRPASLEGVEVLRGDPERLPELLDAAKGCETIWAASKPPLPTWRTRLVHIHDNVVEASGLTGATAVLVNPTWGLKPVYGVPLGVDAPKLDSMDRNSPLGELRGQMEDQLEQNAVLRNVRSLVVRAPTLVGAGVRDRWIGAMRDAAKAGQAVPWYTALDTGHAFADVEDVVEVALRVLLLTERPTFDVVHVAGHYVETAKAWTELLAAAAGRSLPAPRRVPAWWLALSGLWDAEARAFASVRSHWEGPVLLDDVRTRALLPGWGPRPLADTLRTWLAGA